MPNLRRIGAEAEDRAADFLLGLGYTIVTRRFKSSRGEIDIIALDGKTLVFVEVKFRNNPNSLPEEAVDEKKIKHFAKAAEEYVYKSEMQECPMRFDMIAVTPSELRHHVDAFRT